LRPGPDKPKLIQLSTRSEAEEWHVKAISMLAINTIRVLAMDAGAPLAWHLRRAIGGSELAVAFATGMCTQPNLGASASAISATPLADFGVVLITSAEPPRRLWLPHSYEFLEHRTLLR
jgi:hypothetical protein